MAVTLIKGRWGSAWVRIYGTEKQKRLLDEPLVPLPDNYTHWICEIDSPQELESIRGSVKRGAPYGDSLWVEKMMVSHPNLSASLRNPWRPEKKKGAG